MLSQVRIIRFDMDSKSHQPMLTETSVDNN